MKQPVSGGEVTAGLDEAPVGIGGRTATETKHIK